MEAVAAEIGRAGTQYAPPAAYSSWQTGRVERMSAAVRGTIRRTAVHMRLRREACWSHEAAAAINHRPGASGVSPALFLFGEPAKLLGETYADGVPAARHPEADDPSTALARRFRIRLACKRARDLLRRSVSARTRSVKEVEIGQCIMFFAVLHTGSYQEAVGKGLFSWTRHGDGLA